MKKLIHTSILLLASNVCVAQIPNSGFEQLNADSSIAFWAPSCPLSFTIGDSIAIDNNKFVSYSTNARTGKYALQLSNGKNITHNYPYTGCAISTNQAQAFFGYVNSFAITTKPQYFNFYYLLQNNVYNDTSICIVKLINNMGNEIATGQQFITQNNINYALQTVSIIYDNNIDTTMMGNLTPTTANIQFKNTSGTSIAHYGTRLLIDDMGFNGPSAIINIAGNQNFVYPNPANTVLQINLQDNIVSTQLINNLGQVVLNGNSKTISIAHLPTGIYTILVTTANNIYTQQVSKL